ncbi:hypothetical protein LSTR_LSTR012202 [Laodelphax striatellus]|uniref:G-protein coupled receptors family 1 profile domain-containing protein n=1 Tax=Laodelphax striatellus TaxID=195883 RepID=A0A482XPY6_LAOST|nr:hypothetical protein LSTR_LSTR012202 [Laodelphax striatellus]
MNRSLLLLNESTWLDDLGPSGRGDLEAVGRMRSVLEQVQMYYVPVLVTLGTAGNLLSVLVFFCTKLRKLSSSYYLAALAASDTGFLATLFIAWLPIINVPLFNKPVICQASIYVNSVCSFVSVWLVVAFTVERFIVVLYPLQRQAVCTVTRAKAVLAILVMVALIIYAPCIITSAPQLRPDPITNTTHVVCILVDRYHDLANLLNSVDVMLTLVFPFVLIVTLNALICRTVWRLARVRRGMTLPHHSEQSPATGGGNCTVRSSRKLQQSSCTAAARPNRKRSPSSSAKVTEMLLVVSTVFIVLNLPSYIVRIWIYASPPNNNEHNNWQIILQHYFLVLFNTNYGINFVLYCVSGQNFRRALLSLFCRRGRRLTENTTVTVLSEFNRSISRRRTLTTKNGDWQNGEQLALTTYNHNVGQDRTN